MKKLSFTLFFSLFAILVIAQADFKYNFISDIITNKDDSIYIDFENLDNSLLTDYIKITKNANDPTLFTLSTYFENGKIFKKYTDISLIDSVHAKYEEWFKNGQLKEIYYLDDNNTYSQLITYWKNGQMKRKDLFDKGELTKGVTWDSTGNEVNYYPYIIQPSFPGGPTGLRSFIANNLKYPERAAIEGIQGKVFIGFVVEKDGSVINTHVVRRVDPYLDEEALRVVNILPRWRPGQKDGENIRFSYFIPINFALQ